MPKSNKYWANRKAQRMFVYMESAENTADTISQLYLKSSRYISHEAESIFEKFKTKHHLSEAEAYRLLNQLSGKTSIEALKEALKTPGSGQARAEILARLESPAYQARIERLQQLQNEIDRTMHNIYGQEKDFSTKHYVDLANESYYKSIFDIQQRVGFSFGFNTIDSNAIDRIINSKWLGSNYSQRIWKNTQALAKELKEELLINMVTGRTDREVAEILQNKFASGASDARRLVRTESCNLVNQMEMKSYEECDIEYYRFVATLDLRTSSMCRALDRNRYKVSEQQPGFNCPPMHPWCRSTTICDISDAELSQTKRRARNPGKGKTETVPADTTYSEWYDKNVTNNPDAQIEEKKLKNKHSDRKQHEKYRNILGKGVPESFAKFQNLKYNDSDKWNSLQATKQDRINQMDFKNMDGLVKSLSDKETRQWYKVHDEAIAAKIDTSKPIKEQAQQAHAMRNEYRTQARELMKDQEARRWLDEKHPNPSFAQIMEHKKMKYGLTDDEAYKDIVRSSGTTNKKYDKIAGVEE